MGYRPGADCGSDHELLIAKFRLKLKKIGETTRPFRYDLNQIPYNYTVEVIDRVSEELWTEVCDCTGGSDQDHPQKKKCKKAKWLSGEALQIAVKRREEKSKEKRKDTPIRMASSKEQQGEIKSLPQRSMQRNRGK